MIVFLIFFKLRSFLSSINLLFLALGQSTISLQHDTLSDFLAIILFLSFSSTTLIDFSGLIGLALNLFLTTLVKFDLTLKSGWRTKQVKSMMSIFFTALFFCSSNISSTLKPAASKIALNYRLFLQTAFYSLSKRNDYSFSVFSFRKIRPLLSFSPLVRPLSFAQTKKSAMSSSVRQQRTHWIQIASYL